MALLQVKKRMMAVAGVILTGYLILQMLINLSFFNPVAFDAFYVFFNQPFIRLPIWIAVICALGLHVFVAIQIRIQNSRARRQPYQHRQHHWIPAWLVSTVIGLILLFILFHFFQMLRFSADISAYQQTRALFQSPVIVLIYLGGLGLLSLHLHHALLNVLQTLGKTARQYFWSVTAFIGLLITGLAIVPISAYWMG